MPHLVRNGRPCHRHFQPLASKPKGDPDQSTDLKPLEGGGGGANNAPSFRTIQWARKCDSIDLISLHVVRFHGL